MTDLSTSFTKRKAVTVTSLDEVPSLEKPDAWVPKIPKEQERDIIIAYAPIEQMHYIFVSSEFKEVNQLLELQDMIRQRGACKISNVEPALMFGLGSRLSNTTVLSQTRKEKSKNRDLFLLVMNEGIKLGATDVHFCVREDTGRILFRIHGILRRWRQFGSDDLRGAVSVGYTMDAQEKTRSQGAFNADLAQECMIPFESELGEKYNLRYQSQPCIGGFDVSLRYLKSSARSKVLALDQAGYEPSQIEMFNYACSKANGVTIISGITGSGKTTTLNTLLATLPDKSKKKIYAYEDPTEFRMFGVTQVSVSKTASESDNPFKKPLKNFLRLDPDVGMVGEIRDDESAIILQSAVETGHQMFTTVHSNSAMGILKRLTSPQIRLTRDVLAADDFLTCLVYQRLVPTNCPHCKVPARGVLSESKIAVLETTFKLDVDKMFCASEEGCEHCLIENLDEDDDEPSQSTALDAKRLGINGVTVIAEIILPDDEFRSFIAAGDDIGAKRYWRSQRRVGFNHPDMRGKTAFEHGIYKASTGLVDIRFIEDTLMGVEFYKPQEIQGYQ